MLSRKQQRLCGFQAKRVGWRFKLPDNCANPLDRHRTGAYKEGTLRAAPFWEGQMAIYNNYFPASAISKAMFNFDAFGISNFRYAGTVRVSTSDNFSYADYQSISYSYFYGALYTSPSFSGEAPWSGQTGANIQEILGIYGQFAQITFAWQGDYDFIGTDITANPEDVGRANVSDINITWTFRPEVQLAGASGGSYDNLIFGYVGGAGDIFLNGAASAFGGNYTLDPNTRARQVLMHELGHSLGLSHPHTSYANGGASLTSDYAATVGLGFAQLGFAINGAADMYKEYFTIMSYDDQVSVLPGSNVIWQAHTPMILDVIALQEAYGEGVGTSGSGNDTIAAGNAGYRTYFDRGGLDSIDMSAYAEGAYLNMGVVIAGAPHLVGVGMSLYDAQTTILNGGDPKHLRWFYGEFENAAGSSWSDLLIGNLMANSISGLQGDDVIFGGEGNDNIDGGAGNDQLDGGPGDDVFDWDANQRDGNDTLTGGRGNDVYVLDSVFDVVEEMSLEGIDTVIVGFNYSLAGTALENLGTFFDQTSGVIFVGNDWANVIGGGVGGDALSGGDGNDTLTGGAGNDNINGGNGLDIAMYSAGKASYTVRSTGQGFTVLGSEGVDTLTGVERLKFADVNVALDINGSAGQAYRLYQAAFNRIPDVPGLGFQMKALDDGWAITAIAQNFIDSPEFSATYGALNDSQFVTQLYANVLHRAPDAGGLAYHVERLHTVPRSYVLVGFSESPENQAAVIGVIENGMIYTI
jgi:Ca2+-binding RTX toxin-like protein